MSGSIVDEIKEQAIKELDRIADKAVDLMKGYCPQGGKPWSTGNLKASIHKEAEGRFVRLVGTDVRGENGFPYARSVDQGRGPVSPQRVYRHPWDKAPSLYLKGYGIWMKPGKSVAGASAQKFVENTKNALEGSE